MAALAAGQKVKITGFSSQFDTDYEIDPRFQQDVVALSPADSCQGNGR